MKKRDFDNLLEGIKQVGQIHRGETPPSRQFEVTPSSNGKASKALRSPRIYSPKDLKRFAAADKLSPANRAWLEQNFPRPKGQKGRKGR